ncbi:MAG: hypothetical protein U0984_15775 [Prosthecobacter sp.]|nr:hypothetical protein [Prosthecobacter sp.]
MAKHFPKSLADQLDKAEVYDEFCALMFDEGMRYEDLLEQLEKWNISSSLGSLHRFWESQRSPWTIARAKVLAAQAYDMAPADLDDAQRRALRERVFSLSVSPNVSEKALLKMRDQEIKIAMLAQNDRRIGILEGKMKEASDKLQELRDPVKADDAAMRQRILDEVDRAMGIKH